MSSLSETTEKLLGEQWEGNGQYVRATVCPSLYPQVGACVFSGSSGALAWLATGSLGSPEGKSYYLCCSLDQDEEQGEPWLERLWLTKRDVEKAFGIDDPELSKGVEGKDRKFARRGQNLVFFSPVHGRPFSILVTPDIRDTIKSFLNQYHT